MTLGGLPVWASLMLVRSTQARSDEWHVRSGWSASGGWRTRCGREFKRVFEAPAAVVSGKIELPLESMLVCHTCERRWRKLVGG